MRRLRTRPPILGAVAAGLDAFAAELGRRAEGVLAPSQWEEGVHFAVDVGPRQAAVVRALRARVLPALSAGIGTTHLEYPSAQAYAAVLVAMRCVQDAGSFDDPLVISAARHLRCTTFFGRFGLGDDGRQRDHDVLVVQWHAGVKRIVWPARPRRGRARRQHACETWPRPVQGPHITETACSLSLTAAMIGLLHPVPGQATYATSRNGYRGATCVSGRGARRQSADMAQVRAAFGCCAERRSVRRSTSNDSTLHTGRRATVGHAGTVRFPGAGGLSDPSPCGLLRHSRPSLRSRLLRCLAGRVLYARLPSRRPSSLFVAGALRAVAFETPFFVVLRAGAFRAVAFFFDGRTGIVPLARFDVLALPVVLRGLVSARPRTVRVPGPGTKTDWSPVAH